MVRTSLIAAHHLHTIQHADVIFVIKDGALAEQGTHQELLKRKGVYAELYELQTTDRQDALERPGRTKREPAR